jgi:hypothetical protein
MTPPEPEYDLVPTSRLQHACRVCGATVADKDRHTAWHTSLVNVLEMIASAVDEARGVEAGTS